MTKRKKELNLGSFGMDSWNKIQKE